jgi:hypothetical protein
MSPTADAALATLQVACETGTPASLMAAHMALSCAGRLKSASAEGVVVELSRPPPEPLREGAACAVTFPLAGRSAGFAARAKGVEPGAGTTVLVTLEVPARIQYNEQRISVRVPVPDGALGAAILKGGEQLHAVRPIDISLHGILIEVPPGEAAELAEGHRRMLALKFEGKTVLLEVEVRRHDGLRYGMLFIARGAPPRELVKIVATLQQRWSEEQE